MDSLDSDTKWWLGGILDGDGCIQIGTQGYLSLNVTQSVKGINLLDTLNELVGGNYVKGGEPKKDTHRQVYHWGIYGSKASKICGALSKFCHLKKPQMELGAELENASCQQRLLSRKEFQLLKKVPHNPIDYAPLAYIGGIMDTDGSMRVSPALKVQVGQKYSALTTFLVESFGGGVTIEKRSNGPFYRWQIYCSKATEFLRLVRPFIIAKKDQCDVVLDFVDKKIDRKEAHTRLQGLQGNQGGIKKPFKPRNPKKLTAPPKEGVS